MSIMLIHGVPDTHRLWSPILSELGDIDAVCLDLPGFGVEVPSGFSGTMDAHAAWLGHQLDHAVARSGHPVHLVGHDWGGLLVQRIAGLHPDKVASWAVGGVAIDEDYVWHDVARIWQTPGEGEALMAGTDEALLVAMLTEAQVPEIHALEMARHGDDRMKDAILNLYRSATSIGDDWGDALPGLTQTPGLVVWGEHDLYASVAVGQKLASRTNARFHEFKACGHWWPYERAGETADLLQQHWARARSTP